jgi:ribose 1,5-bisphosphokinase
MGGAQEMSAQLVYVIGPSGAGKDSLLAWLREHMRASAPIHWARRSITRPENAGGESHESLSEIEFRQVLQERGFALHWAANGLHYGIRHKELAPLRNKNWVMLNGSRAHLEQAVRQYPGMTVLHITASPEILRSRLISRGRETADAIEARIHRAVNMQWPADCHLIEVSNNESLQTAGEQLLHKLRNLGDWPS